MTNYLKIGIDVGSTTVKVVVLDADNNIIFERYCRHNAKINETVCGILDELPELVGDRMLSVGITGSIGLGIAQNADLCFVQEVAAASKTTQQLYGKKIKSMIDIGGEDAKVVFFDDKGTPTDLRMNGNCAAGTGAFIDQMAIILGVHIDQLSDLALAADHVFPIASRCGVFCKTDIQNLIAKNVSKENIAASVFHAVAVQTVTTLAHGYDIQPPVLFCGGPLTFTPALQKELTSYLKLDEKDVLTPEKGKYFPAIGAALGSKETPYNIKQLKNVIQESFNKTDSSNQLPPIFESEAEYRDWKKRINNLSDSTIALPKSKTDVFIGIDSGSTTTKVVITDRNANILFSYYSPNNGDPIGTAKTGLSLFDEECRKNGTEANVCGSCSTGYGEDLLKAAFNLDHGIIETIAHYIAAKHIDPNVSFILDIGGQDMKAIYVDNGVINRMEINEACSSGCGSFVETFANSLGYKVSEFAALACTAKRPCDLGTRCTVFMNSKVKQVLREGYGADDIAAGLAYSVVKNCLYKVLKLKDTSSLGSHIVVQGGTMKNDAIVRALEKTTGATVSRHASPELMGAYGCAIYAINNA